MKVYAHKEPGGKAEEMDIEDPVLSGREVLIDITNSGVCHSDVHSQEGFFDLGNLGKMPLTRLGAEYPMVFGHEIVGQVNKTGPESNLESDGKRYLIYPWIGCGECDACQNEMENYCTGLPRSLGIQKHGGYAQQVVVPDENYLIDIGDLEPSWAATLACSGLTTYAATSKLLPLSPDKPVAIIGAGGLGLMAIAVLKDRGHDRIIAIDINENSLSIAKSMGATDTLVSTEDNVSEELKTLSQGGVAGVLDFVNNDATSTLALSSLITGGTLVSVGLYGGQINFPTAPIALKQFSIKGNFVGTLGELRALVDLAKNSNLPRMPIQEKPLDADAVNEAIDQLRSGQSSGRTVLVK